LRIGDNLCLQNQVIMVQFKDKCKRFRTEQLLPLTDSQWQVIEKFLDDGRKRQYCLRKIFDLIRKVIRTGTQWRNLFFLDSNPYCSWELVYYYYRKWQIDSIISDILALLVEKERERQGRQAKASACAIDSQSVKKGSFISLETGIDGAKLVNGRKRHLAVDTLGLPLAMHVSAANIQDGEAGKELLWQLDKVSNRLELLRTDKAYRGEFVQCADYYKWKVEITQKPPSEQGFIPQTGRWQVERSFGWFNFHRRLAKDFEKTIESSVCVMQIAFIDIILARF
jgi:putative transposase